MRRNPKGPYFKCNMKLVLAITGAEKISGGIASLNLNILHSIKELSKEKNTNVRILSYLESDKDKPNFLPPRISFRGCEGDKKSFSISLIKESFKQTAFIFDHVTLALPVLPFAAAGLIRTVIYAHGSEAWREVRATSKWSFQQADLCLTNSHFTLRKMKSRFSGFNAEPCPLGLSPKFELSSTIPDSAERSLHLEAADGKKYLLGERLLLLVGRMSKSEPGKGRRVLLKVLPDLVESDSRVQVAFPGQGDELEELKRTAHRQGVSDRVFFPGFVSEKLLKQFYRQCFAYVMPSQQEGFGLVYLEAMNYGKPCVGCSDDGAEDIIVDGETGLLIEDRKNKREVEKKLKWLVSCPEEAERMGKKGFKRLHNKFTSGKFRNRFKKHLIKYTKS